MLKRKIIDYTENDIYDYFGCSTDIWQADRHDLLAVIGGMSGILELLWHKEITPEVSFNDFKEWLEDNQPIDVEIIDDTRKES